jgi:hypothetical protein
MGFGYLGTSVSMSTNDVRQGLTAAQKIVDSIENDLRVLKGRGAPASSWVQRRSSCGRRQSAATSCGRG